jgi:hypothetical protein
MERWTAKLLALIGAFVLPLLCTILPYKISGFVASKGAVGKRTLSYLMCLGGGIFFGTYLLHMGPEVQNILKTSLLDPHGITYPVAELIAGAGFFIVLFAEKFVLRWNKRRTSRKLSKLTTLTVDVVNVTVNHTEEQATLVSARRPDVVHCTNSDEPCAKCLAGEPCSGLYEEM